ncbi:MAG: hypothetical protein DMF80_18825 [Acidobacteria bacterium]|nr:MAG: hypothetical protein DMF80_18825 [Acidobacteriota bacterium]
MASFLVAVAISGRASGSFLIGLWTGTLVVAVAGLVWSVQRRPSGPRDSAEPAPKAPRPGSLRWMLLSGLVALLPVAYLTLAGDFFDDFNAIGHRSLIAQFQNDVFPPRHQVFPEYPFRYHYGFNLLAAALTALFRLSVPWAIDLLVIVCFLWSWCLAWVLGERLTRSGSGGWTALASLGGGGAFFWLIAHAHWASQGAVGIVIGGNRINFPVVMYFFQKPFTLGFPLALAVMLAASFPAPGLGWLRRSSLLAVLLASLYLVQEELFVTVGLSLAAQELLRERHLRALVPVAASLPLAVLMGGVLFTPMPERHGELLRVRFWPAQGDPWGVLAWYALTSGLLLPLGIAGLFATRRLRTLLLLLMLGSFGAPLFFENPYSWDIVKLATIGELAAGLAAGSVLAALAEKPTWPRASLLAVLVILLVASPVGYLGYWIREMVRPTPEIGQPLAMQRDLPRVDDWEKVLRWLRGQRSLEGTIYAMNPRLSQMILLAGLNGAGPPRWIDLEFGVPQDRIDRRSVLLKELPRDPRAWRREGVSWFVVGPGEPVAPTVQAWVASRAARAVKAAGPWTIYHLEAPSR